MSKLLLVPVVDIPLLGDIFTINMNQIYEKRKTGVIDPFEDKGMEFLQWLNKFFDMRSPLALKRVFTDPFVLSSPLNLPIKVKAISCSSNNLKQFAEDLSDLNIDHATILVPETKDIDGNNIPAEGFDHALAVSLELRKAYIVLVDEKSADEKRITESEPYHWSGHFMGEGKNPKPPYYQYFRMCEKQDNICDSQKTGGPYLEALKNGDWIYIYFTTHEGPNIYLKRKDFVDIIGKDGDIYHKAIVNRKYGSVLVLNRETAKSFLSIIGNVYIAARSYL
jgi:hypothetical protein